MEIQPHHLRRKRESNLREGFNDSLISTVDRSRRLPQRAFQASIERKV
jgi:hypothetical protein